jgi:hypothetical protein
MAGGGEDRDTLRRSAAAAGREEGGGVRLGVCETVWTGNWNGSPRKTQSDLKKIKAQMPIK